MMPLGKGFDGLDSNMRNPSRKAATKKCSSFGERQAMEATVRVRASCRYCGFYSDLPRATVSPEEGASAFGDHHNHARALTNSLPAESARNIAGMHFSHPTADGDRHGIRKSGLPAGPGVPCRKGSRACGMVRLVARAVSGECGQRLWLSRKIGRSIGHNASPRDWRWGWVVGGTTWVFITGRSGKSGFVKKWYDAARCAERRPFFQNGQ